jgi:CheY-like chemotaxis protein
MLTLEDLSRDLAAAYERLYDIAYLRAHPLDGLPTMTAHPTQDRGWQMHHALIKAVDELNPGNHAPAMSKEWRRHRLMRLRYVDGLTPQDVADALAISRRQYYRVHDEAIHALAEAVLSRQPDAIPQRIQPAPSDRLELLRAERELHGADNQAVQLAPVINSALSLLADRLIQHGIQIRLALPEALPALKADPKLLRQLLLSVTDYLVERADDAALHITTQGEEMTMHIQINIEPAAGVQRNAQGNEREQLAACEELAALNGVTLTTLTTLATDDRVHGFVLRAPIEAALPKVLAIDDNADTLELYRRYLAPLGYDIVTARHSHEALDLLERHKPIAIFLDLMLPEQDGWDILQALKSQPGARDIPVFICSVLMQRELALSLGATGFLQKPFTPNALQAALDGLKVSSS